MPTNDKMTEADYIAKINDLESRLRMLSDLYWRYTQLYADTAKKLKDLEDNQVRYGRMIEAKLAKHLRNIKRISGNFFKTYSNVYAVYHMYSSVKIQ